MELFRIAVTTPSGTRTHNNMRQSEVNSLITYLTELNDRTFNNADFHLDYKIKVTPMESTV